MRRTLRLALFFIGCALCVIGLLALFAGLYVPLPQSVAEHVIQLARPGGRRAIVFAVRLMHAIGYSPPFVAGGACLLGSVLLARPTRHADQPVEHVA